ncbi:segregation/condensation protein A [Enterococcus sp. BWB1-3]|uniref:segregation/condensation protein A n=1 Tax=unclassified Enterococcus TaxID=2608891 RepID=UPI0019212A79|nr:MULTISPECIES: segregation/condensation protein A [unclassified Enterococcus]MBL1228597.1 segregation/condensation protein A [Enterococcus sp. BWB1-3]MCB5950603.1 segregation/condensation protein A [Enterococcus sp. BWT-B8]MCB5955927.1 segregation/condensation protein A [Enterococcus sp. CWB-B31]
MQEINIKLDIFEGPLDLLLHLIKKLEIDIYDIPITAVTEQYMGYIHAMQSLELEIAGEYLVMAATLMAIKSKMLLPKQELEVTDEEELEGEDPREALVTQLLEYRKFKYAAGLLHEKEAERSLYYTKEPMDIEEYREVQPLLKPNQLNTIDLFLAFHSMLEKRKKRQPVQTTVTGEDVSIEMKLAELTEKIGSLHSNEPVELDSFFESYSKQEIVTTFMALLELMKKHLVRVEQESNYGSIFLYNAQSNNETTNDLEETT